MRPLGPKMVLSLLDCPQLVSFPASVFTKHQKQQVAPRAEASSRGTYHVVKVLMGSTCFRVLCYMPGLLDASAGSEQCFLELLRVRLEVYSMQLICLTTCLNLFLFSWYQNLFASPFKALIKFPSVVDSTSCKRSDFLRNFLLKQYAVLF